MYEHYLGEYITIRPKYSDTSIVKSYLTRIYWNDSLSCYCFEERNRLDAEYTQRGHLYIPLGSGCMYLMTIDKGWVRTVVVSQMVAGLVEMRGLITSQFNIAGPAYAPVSAPIAYIKVTAAASPSFGELTKTDSNYEQYMRLLQETLQTTYARIALPPMPPVHPNVVPLQPRQNST